MGGMSLENAMTTTGWCKRLIAAAFCSLAVTATLPAQVPARDYPVKIIVRDSAGERRTVGRLVAVRRDSLVLRVTEGDSLMAFDRRTVIRVQRKHHASIRRNAVGGCLLLGATVGLIGSQFDVPDSGGKDRETIVAAMIVGCGFGGLGGVIGGWLSRRAWEDTTLPLSEERIH